jgi:hypothetical protein
MSPYRPNRKTRRSKKYRKLMSEETKQENAGIGIADLVAVIKIIDVASERGSFKGPELSSVGQIRDKVAAFIDENKPAETSSDETTQGEEATEETSE